jgi:hypothetical protein
MPLQIRFAIHEKDLLLFLKGIDPEIARKLKHAMLQNNFITINVDEDELEKLAGVVAAEAVHSGTHKHEEELRALSRRLEEVLRIHLSS